MTEALLLKVMGQAIQVEFQPLMELILLAKDIFNYMKESFMSQKNLLQLTLKQWKKYGIMKAMLCFLEHMT